MSQKYDICYSESVGHCPYQNPVTYQGTKELLWVNVVVHDAYLNIKTELPKHQCFP